MNMKIALSAVVIGLSSQASFAATDTSCNPFLAGWGCKGASVSAVSTTPAAKHFASFSNYGLSKKFSVGINNGVKNGFKKGGFSDFLASLKGPKKQSVETDDNQVAGGSGSGSGSGTGDQGEVSVVPVPASGFLLLAGLGGLALARRRKG